MENTELSLVVPVANAKDLALLFPPGVEAYVTGTNRRSNKVLCRLFSNDLLHGRSRRRHCTGHRQVLQLCPQPQASSDTQSINGLINVTTGAGVTLSITGIVLLVDVELVFICTSIRSCGTASMVSTICY